MRGFPSGGGSVPGSIAIASSAVPGSLNLTAEGTVDWFAIINAAMPRSNTTSQDRHGKILGHGMLDTFSWVGQGTGGLSGGGLSRSSSASDDIGTPLSANPNYGYYWTASAVLTGLGFCFYAPAFPTTRVLRVYLGLFSCTVTVTASLSDGSFANQTDAIDSGGAGAGTTRMFTITYNGSLVGTSLRVSALMTTNHGSSPNVAFTAATLGTV